MRFQLNVQIVAAIAISYAFAACESRQASLSESVIAGVYQYHSDEPGSDTSVHQLDRLTLLSDGKYELVQGGQTGRKSKKMGVWHLLHGERPQILLDHDGYPVQVSAREVKLLIDNDVGAWFSKVK